MTRALLLLGVAYRMRRTRRLFRAGRFDECMRTHDAIDRDFARLGL